MPKMKQNDWVLKMLQSGEKLTQAKASAEFGVGRLAARVKNLREEGHDIISTTLVVINPHGAKCQIAEYSMKRSED